MDRAPLETFLEHKRKAQIITLCCLGSLAEGKDRQEDFRLGKQEKSEYCVAPAHIDYQRLECKIRQHE